MTPNNTNNVTCFPHQCYYKQEEGYIYNMLADAKDQAERIERKLDMVLMKLDALAEKVDRLDRDERQTQDAVLQLTRKLLKILDEK